MIWARLLGSFFKRRKRTRPRLKAVTAARGVRHSGTHDLDRLMEILEELGVELSLDRDRLAVLTQYAVPLRYDELLDAESLEREALVVLVDEVAAWAKVQLGAADE